MKIRFCSPVKSHTGYAEMGRLVISQLVEAGFEVSVVDIPDQTSDADLGPLGAQAADLVGDTQSATLNIVNMIPPLFERFRLEGAKNIGYTTFESDRIPADWVVQCNQMDALWVTSIWVRDVFKASGVTVPIAVVGPHAVETPPSAPAPSGQFRLLSIFEWSARKNPFNLVRAYCAAFDGHTDTVLTLKAHRGTDVAKSAAYVRNTVDFCLTRQKPSRSMPRIEAAVEVLSSAQIQRLHAESHGYLSLSHSEGWGLPAWEATLSGKPVIHTGWSAPAEFVHPQGLIKYSLSPIYGTEDFVPYYDIGMNWAEPHMDDAIAKLRDLYANYSTWTRNSLAHRSVVNEKYSLARRVEQLKIAIRSSL